MARMRAAEEKHKRMSRQLSASDSDAALASGEDSGALAEAVFKMEVFVEPAGRAIEVDVTPITTAGRLCDQCAELTKIGDSDWALFETLEHGKLGARACTAGRCAHARAGGLL